MAMQNARKLEQCRVHIGEAEQCRQLDNIGP